MRFYQAVFILISMILLLSTFLPCMPSRRKIETDHDDPTQPVPNRKGHIHDWSDQIT